MLNVKIKTKPITKLLHFIRIPFFYVSGGNFRITAKIKNFDSAEFQGGAITILIRYAFGNLTELIQMRVDAIEPQKEVKVDFKGHDIWGVLAQGHALFWVYVVDKATKPIDLCDEKGKTLQRQPDTEASDDEKQLLPKIVYRYHVHTFHSLSFGELCSLIALMVNTFAFITNIVLVAIVNNEKLSGLWNAFVNYTVPLLNYTVPLFTIVALSLVIIVALWIVFVYYIYDRYGLYK